MPAAAAAALVLAACGSNGPNTTGTSASASGSQQNGASAAYRFSACMRSHGVTNFPDPVVHQSGNSESVGIRITPAQSGSPSFKSAQKACQGILPGPKGNGNGLSPAQQQKRTHDFVAFAQCLRTHGYPNFPDPNSQGELSPTAIPAAGINVHAPGFYNVAKGCLPAIAQFVSVAQLQQAINRLPAPGTSTGG